MSKLREAAQQALEALENGKRVRAGEGGTKYQIPLEDNAIAALRAALAEPVQEPASFLRERAQLEQEWCELKRLQAQYKQPQEPVGWMPIEQPYPQGSELDILMGDGSILCAVFPQADGDLWWSGSGTGEKFIDPRYANVTHWRIHSDTHPAPQRQPLTDEEIADVVVEMNGNEPTAQFWRDLARAIEAAHGIGGQDDTR